MSDTMPERCCQSYKCDICHTVYVPEQRALDAERAGERYRKQWLEAVDELGVVAGERNALRADLKALLPLAAKGWGELVGTEYEDSPEGIAARAILDREGA